MNKVALAVAGLALVVALGGYLFPNTVNTVVEKLGSAGQDHSFLEFFDGGLTWGGGCYATSTGSALTARVLENGCVYINPAGAGMSAVSLTMPASSTMYMIPRPGNCHEWFIDNSDVAAATTTTIVAGTGHDVVGLDATGAGTGADVIDGLEYAELKSCRNRDGSVVTFMKENIHAD